jgi:hypothetical protein
MFIAPSFYVTPSPVRGDMHMPLLRSLADYSRVEL